MFMSADRKTSTDVYKALWNFPKLHINTENLGLSDFLWDAVILYIILSETCTIAKTVNWFTDRQYHLVLSLTIS